MDERMKELCEQHMVDFYELLDKVQSGLKGHDISHFTDGELSVINAALEVAGGV